MVIKCLENHPIDFICLQSISGLRLAHDWKGQRQLKDNHDLSKSYFEESNLTRNMTKITVQDLYEVRLKELKSD